MGYKMKGAPMMDNSKKHGTNANYKNSGMKYADGSAVKPGAPGFFGKLVDPLGLRKKIGGLFNKNKGGTKPVDPNAAPPIDPNAPPVAPPVDPDVAAGPVAPPVAAPVAPPVAGAVDPNAVTQ
jgi:hypothetical protein